MKASINFWQRKINIVSKRIKVIVRCDKTATITTTTTAKAAALIAVKLYWKVISHSMLLRPPHTFNCDKLLYWCNLICWPVNLQGMNVRGLPSHIRRLPKWTFHRIKIILVWFHSHAIKMYFPFFAINFDRWCVCVCVYMS